jgi:hypothetical protein
MDIFYTFVACPVCLSTTGTWLLPQTQCRADEEESGEAHTEI